MTRNTLKTVSVEFLGYHKPLAERAENACVCVGCSGKTLRRCNQSFDFQFSVWTEHCAGPEVKGRRREHSEQPQNTGVEVALTEISPLFLSLLYVYVCICL